MAASQRLHQSTWLSVDAYIALTPFMKQRMHELGVPEARVSVRPTPVQDPGEPRPPSGRSVLFVGRLDASKGVDQLLLAWKRASLRDAGWILRVVGDGPLAGSVRSAAARDSSIDFQGRLAGEALSRRFKEAAVVCLPSQWYEGFPRVLAEAASHGRAVVVSNLGGLADIARAAGGFVIDQTTAQAMALVFDSLQQADLAAAGRAAREYYVKELSPAIALHKLLKTYEETVARGPARLSI